MKRIFVILFCTLLLTSCADLLGFPAEITFVNDSYETITLIAIDGKKTESKAVSLGHGGKAGFTVEPGAYDAIAFSSTGAFWDWSNIDAEGGQEYELHCKP